MTSGYAEKLAAYFSGRRWFTGKGRGFSVTHVYTMPWLTESEAGTGTRVRIEIVSVEYDDGRSDSYQFPVAYLPAEDPAYSHALVGTVEDDELGTVAAYDAVYLKEASGMFLRGFHKRKESGDVSFRVVEEAELPGEDAVGTVMTAEQSNTSIAFGNEAILKLFRRVTSGHNPDIEIQVALTRRADEHVAPLLGWLHGAWADSTGAPVEGDLGMLQVFLRTATDGWDLATASVRDLLIEADLYPDEVGGDFAGEAERLGEATAIVHRHLAEIFGTDTLTSDQLGALAAAMGERLSGAVKTVPELEAHARGLLDRYDRLARLVVPVQVQRIHGDFHLGQTLRTVNGWKIIDFEGEPAKPLPERQARDCVLRDVAGMLRSFSYASGATLHQFGMTEQLHYRADEWTARNSAAFLVGYLGQSASIPGQQELLAAYEADKAVYEAVYETRNRPAWLAIPLRAIERIATTEV
ncbi:MAG: maltokinase N-terminal cap-like domain-containing protein [Nocardioidaceae bacterium]